MPGAYAHITLINETRQIAVADVNIPTNVKIALLDYVNCCELGGISPDYPYLDVLNNTSAPWADLMHYTRTTTMIVAGTKRLMTLHGNKKTKSFAWLLGYAAHVVADVTIHPIVELKVGPYAQNKTAHRVCEMNQDAYIFQRMNLGKVGLSEYLDKQNNGIMACHRSGDESRIDEAIFDLWDGMFQDVHPTKYAELAPDIDAWHAHFGPIVDTIEDGSALPAFARHVAVGQGLTYPEPSEIDKAEFIENLETPEGNQHYDVIFDRACANVSALWAKIGHDLQAGEIQHLNDLGAWNLDTGRDQDSGDALVFWGA